MRLLYHGVIGLELLIESRLKIMDVHNKLGSTNMGKSNCVNNSLCSWTDSSKISIFFLINLFYIILNSFTQKLNIIIWFFF